jgi:hypothetical protein
MAVVASLAPRFKIPKNVFFGNPEPIVKRSVLFPSVTQPNQLNNPLPTDGVSTLRNSITSRKPTVVERTVIKIRDIFKGMIPVRSDNSPVPGEALVTKGDSISSIGYHVLRSLSQASRAVRLVNYETVKRIVDVINKLVHSFDMTDEQGSEGLDLGFGLGGRRGRFGGRGRPGRRPGRRPGGRPEAGGEQRRRTGAPTQTGRQAGQQARQQGRRARLGSPLRTDAPGNAQNQIRAQPTPGATIQTPARAVTGSAASATRFGARAGASLARGASVFARGIPLLGPAIAGAFEYGRSGSLRNAGIVAAASAGGQAAGAGAGLVTGGVASPFLAAAGGLAAEQIAVQGLIAEEQRRNRSVNQQTQPIRQRQQAQQRPQSAPFSPRSRLGRAGQVSRMPLMPSNQINQLNQTGQTAIVAGGFATPQIAEAILTPQTANFTSLRPSSPSLSVAPPENIMTPTPIQQQQSQGPNEQPSIPNSPPNMRNVNIQRPTLEKNETVPSQSSSIPTPPKPQRRVGEIPNHQFPSGSLLPVNRHGYKDVLTPYSEISGSRAFISY